MIAWIDCEFNGFGGDLISLALVTVDGQEFYEVLDLENDLEYVPWVAENVVPILNKQPIDKLVFQAKLWNFINQWDSLHIVADWPDDIKYLCQALITIPGEAIGTPQRFTMQIDRMLTMQQSAIPHNALEDARAIRQSWLSFHGIVHVI